jgi:hypothetical protein
MPEDCANFIIDLASSPGPSDEPTASVQLIAELRALERLLVDAYATTGRLGMRATEVQREGNLSIMYGTKVYSLVSAAGGNVAAAIETVCDLHRTVEAIARRIGIDTQAYGDHHEKPKSADFFIGARAADAGVAD